MKGVFILWCCVFSGVLNRKYLRRKVYLNFCSVCLAMVLVVFNRDYCVYPGEFVVLMVFSL